LDHKQKSSAAAKPAAPPPVNSGPLQLHFVQANRDLNGRIIALTAGHEEVAPGHPVLCLDPGFRAAAQSQGRQSALKILNDVRERFLQSDGRKKFDGISEQLVALYRDIAIERQLIRGYKDHAREAETNYEAPEEVLRWRDAAAESKRKVEELERRVPILQRQLAAEKALLEKALQGHLQSALAAHQSQHFGKAHAIESQALAAFLPHYAEALHQRIIGEAAGRELIAQTVQSVDLAEPQRPDAEPQAQYAGFAGARS
jgi:hypothetical protein